VQRTAEFHELHDYLSARLFERRPESTGRG
jgi:hypothetical protein